MNTTPYPVSQFGVEPGFIQSDAWHQFQQLVRPATQVVDDIHWQHRSTTIPRLWCWYAPRCAISPSFTLPPNKGAGFFRIEPANPESLLHLRSLAVRNNWLLLPAELLQPWQTMVLNITPPLEEQIVTWKPKHRYNLSVAQRSELTVTTSTTYSEELFERFYQLMEETGKRQGLTNHSHSFYRQCCQTMCQAGMGEFVMVSHRDAGLAAMFLVHHQDTTTYLFGASSEHERKRMAPLLMHATGIEHAKVRGSTWYDLWGSNAQWDPSQGEWKAVENPGSQGITRFKLGFNPQVAHYPGAYDVFTSKFTYLLVALGRATIGKHHHLYR
jgi:lipid II:glycine glycyltransferase (peptidoglycan interpeptide bridge formation enzyme)